MMNKKEITQFAKKIIHSQKGLKNAQLIHPKREWLTGVAVALVIFVASITWSAMEYFKYQTIEEQTVSQSEAPAAVYRETLVTEALSAYAEKAERLHALLEGNALVIPDDNAGEEEVNEEETNSELSENFDTATTTETTSSSSDIQISTENEDQTETPAPPENPTPSRSQTAPIVEEESTQPATNI